MAAADVFEGGEVLEFGGNRLTLRMRAAQTGGVCGVMDFEVAPLVVAPPVLHRHTHEDWWGHVTEGELAIDLGDGERRIPTGGTVFVPRGVAFRWRNPLPLPARWTLTWVPGGFESYFLEVAAAIRAVPPGQAPDVLGIVGPLWAKYGLTVTPAGVS